MDFSSFDDDLFDTCDRSRHRTLDHSYSPKIDSECWFLDYEQSLASPEGGNNYTDFTEKERLRAAYFYWRRDYEKAAESYERLFSDARPGALRLEFMESYVRALVACSRFERSEQVAVEFYGRAINYDQQLQGLNLLSDLYWRQDDFKRCAVVTGALIHQTNGGNGDLWYRIGQCFLHWDENVDGGEDISFIDVGRLPELQCDSKGTSTKEYFQKCLVRSYHLFTAVCATAVGASKGRYEDMRRRIENDLKTVFGTKLGNELIQMPRCNLLDHGEGNEVPESGENDTTQGHNLGEPDKRISDMVLDVDLVTVFEQFLITFLR